MEIFALDAAVSSDVLVCGFDQYLLLMLEFVQRQAGFVFLASNPCNPVPLKSLLVTSLSPVFR